MLRTPQMQTQTQTSSLLSATYNSQQKQQQQQMDKMKMDKLLRKSRSKEYMEALHKLDAGGHVHNQNKVNEIINTIRSEFPEVELAGVLLGYVAICYLGNHMRSIRWILSGGLLNIIKQDSHYQMDLRRHVVSQCVEDMIL